MKKLINLQVIELGKASVLTMGWGLWDHEGITGKAHPNIDGIPRKLTISNNISNGEEDRNEKINQCSSC